MGVGFWHPTLSNCVCAILISHSSIVLISDDARGKFFRVSRLVPPSTKPNLQHMAVAKSARRCSPRRSRRFAKRAMEQCSQNSRGTIAFCLRTLRKTVLFLFPRVPMFGSAVVFSMFPSSWPETASPAPVSYCHRDFLTRWRLALRRMPRVMLLLRLLFVLRIAMCRVSSGSSRGISLQGMRTLWCPVFLRRIWFSHIVLFICCQHCASLMEVDHVIGVTRGALKRDTFLVLRS